MKKKLTQEMIDRHLGISGLVNLEEIPVVQFLENKILNRIELKPQSFNMHYWHSRMLSYREANPYSDYTPYGKVLVQRSFSVEVMDNTGINAEKAVEIAYDCKTTHCRAGWAVVVAGLPGWELEEKVGPRTAGYLIYMKNKGYAPDFSAEDSSALRDIKREAALEFSEEDIAFASKAK